MEFCWAYMTAESEEAASKIAEVLVQERLAACVNILPGIKSIYRWDGQVEKGTETAMIAKTSVAQFSTLCARVQCMHSYEVPCIVQIPIQAGHQPYLDWLAANLGPISSADEPNR